MQGYSSYLMLVGGWFLYFFLHSFLASNKVKGFIFSELALDKKVQRIVYSLISTIGILLLLILNGAVVSDHIIPVTRELKMISLFLTGVGVLIIRSGFKYYNLKSFLGLIDENNKELVKKGILSHIRHPIYSGTILITLGFALFDPRLPTFISTVCIFVYLIVGIRLEEKKLIDQFGQNYIDYKLQVPMLIPRINLLNKSLD